MNILGIGPTELVIIFLLMLMVAGPKRMARWAYVMGIYIGKFRVMWQEASTMIKKELAEAGIEPEVVDTLGKAANPRTRRQTVTGQFDRLVNEMKKPIEESLKPVKDVVNEVGPTPLEPRRPEAKAAPTSGDGSAAPEAEQPGTPQDSSGRYEAWTRN